MSEGINAPVYTVTQTTGDSTVEGSLAWALAEVEAYTGTGVPTIVFDASLSGSTCELPEGVMLTRDVVVRNDGDELVTIKADSSFDVDSSLTLGNGVALSTSWSTVGVSGSLTCEQGSQLSCDVTVYNSASLTLQGATATGSIDLFSGAELVMNDSLISGYIGLTDGASVTGANNSFASATPFAVENAVDLVTMLAGLTGSEYQSERCYVLLNASYSGENITLLSLPEPFLGYSVEYGSYTAQAPCTLSEGVNLYLFADYGTAQLMGSFSFTGDNELYVVTHGSVQQSDVSILLKANSTWEYDEEGNYVEVLHPSVVEMNDCTVNATLEVGAGVDFSALGTHFAAEEALRMILTEWDGSSVPAAYSKLVNCTSSGYISVSLDGLGSDSPVVWSSGVPSELVPAGFTAVHISGIELKLGDSLTLGDNVVWEDTRVVIRNGATFACGTGCSVKPGIDWVDGDFTAYTPCLEIDNGGTFSAEGVTFYGSVHVAPTAAITGTVHFAEDSRLHLREWTGSTAVLKDVLSGAIWTADGPLDVEISGTTTDLITGMTGSDPQIGDVTFVNLGEGFGSYVVPAYDYWQLCHTATFEEGVNLVMEGDAYVCTSTYEYETPAAGKLVLLGNNVVSAAPGWEDATLIIQGLGDSPVIEAHGTRFEVTVDLEQGSVPCISGENVVFAAEVPVIVSLDSWNGDAAALQAALSSALGNLSYTLAHESPRLGLRLENLSTDLVLNAESLKSMAPEGFEGISFEDLWLDYGNTVTVESGALLEIGHGAIINGAIILQEGALLGSRWPTGRIYVSTSYMEEGKRGRLEMTGVDINGMEISCQGGDVTLTRCWGEGSIQLYSQVDDNAGVVRITGCDLSRMQLSCVNTGYGTTAVYDLSGNYWGTSDIEAIKARIEGFDAANIIINDVLLTSPVGGVDTTPPELSLTKPETQKLGEGRTSVTLSWTSNEDATYELWVDNKKVYTGAETSYTLELADGTHSYKVEAVDAAGNSTTQEGESFTLDATSPVLELKAPVTVSKLNGLSTVLFSWTSSEAATYELWIDGERAYAGTETSYSLQLADDTYTYEVVAVDAAGNRITQSGGSFTTDASAPVLQLADPVVETKAEGLSTVVFSWAASGATDYELWVNGKKVYEGKDTSCTLELADGTHSYEVVAKDATGNSTRLSGESLSLDTTGPVITLKSPVKQKLSDGLARVTLSWTSNEAASYELWVNGEKVYTGTATSHTLELADNTYSYKVVATDSLGNVSTTADTTLKVLTVAPAVSYKLTGTTKGKRTVTFSWSGEEGMRYTLTLDGKTYNLGTKTSYARTLTEGVHKFKLVATDSQGNVNGREGSMRVDTAAPTLPTSPKVSLKNVGKTATFSWGVAKDVSGVTYELAYKASSDKSYTYHKNLTSNSLTLDMAKITSYSWMVRAKDGAGNVTSWVKGRNFNNDVVAPVITLNTPSQRKSGTKRATVTFSWKSNERATYILKVDGSTKYSGSGTSRALTLADGVHKYTLTATDAAGNRRTASGSLRVDTTAPTLPTSPKVSIQQQGKRLVFSWGAAKDVSGVTYELAYKLSSAKSYTYKKNLTSNKLTLDVSKISTYNWMVRAKDGRGNTTAWVKGRNFNNDIVAPVLTLPTPTQKKSGTKRALVTISWKSNERATYILKVDGKTIYKGSATYRRLTLTEGVHKYSITATDAAGNRRTSSSSLRVDTIAPTAPKSLKVAVSENGDVATFSWTASTDVSGVTYELGIKAAGATSYTYYRNITEASYSLDLTESSSYSWSLRAKDGKGNVTSWVKGSSFRNELAQPEPETPEDTGCALDRELAVSSGSITMPVENELAVPAAGAALELGADAERRQALQGIALA